MFTITYDNGVSRVFNGGEFTSLIKMRKLVLQIAKENKSIMTVTYNNRDKDIIFERECPE
ncbi:MULTISPECIES: hypothetical protein [Bacillus subtilis group]|uniref:hypothetical protein n=1 Tax=Bacillus subtilis group TaxID=653685 RepID=UPI002DB57048|nr:MULTISPECIES: hypothetical protein [Bacillus subtilis group]MEC0765722.1 hypothetical protein [Bacillus atrophaeus]MEC0781511.1 hypothetical protein [Bacillus atrophaeus]MEC0810160.1 hypothetical protein [Bacillus atrophaeus]MED0777798.1 hypothetical protein [Bacillus siamensis]MED0778000.1 hypothetical protein [Bacillus siamensis]